jgi:galactitol-specific phosphotransferase system IIB component
VAEDIIKQRVEKEGFTDVTVKRILMADIEGYLARTDLVMVVSMMKIFRTFNVPVFQGMPFLIGTKDEKEVMLQKILDVLRKK